MSDRIVLECVQGFHGSEVNVKSEIMTFLCQMVHENSKQTYPCPLHEAIMLPYFTDLDYR
jgi:hypothetical protein